MTILRPSWRATGPYAASSVATAGLLDETKQFLRQYDQSVIQLPDLSMPERAEDVRQALVDGGLVQRSRATRLTVAQRIMDRLIRWNPPAWVMMDLVEMAQIPTDDALKAALLVHVCRQDRVLYAVAQQVILPKWRAGERLVRPTEVQAFFDGEMAAHPEIASWTHATRKRLASNTLSTLRDFGLLQGSNRKQIVEPVIPDVAASHVWRTLVAEGIAPQEIAHHPDWQLWLWTPEQAHQAIQELQS